MLAINLQDRSIDELRVLRMRVIRARWNKAHPEFRKSPTQRRRDLARQARWQAAKPIKMMLIRIRHRAKRLGLPFALQESDIEIPMHCPVLGIPLAFEARGKRGPVHGTPSVDRLTPALGYVPGNIRVISSRANTLRRDASAAELFAVARYAQSLLGDDEEGL